MWAACLHNQAPIGTSPLRFEERPEPSPAAGEVLLAVRACAVCHTDLHIIEGDMPLRHVPLIPGHQIVGVIESVGKGVDAARIGERVGVPWIATSCGQCALCEGGRENLCRAARFTGYDVDGGYAERVVAAARSTHALPDALSDVDAAPLLCAGIIGYRALRLAEIAPGGRLGLYGFGASAHLAIQIARHWGCEVFAFSRDKAHRRLALRLGAAWAGSATDAPPVALDAAVTFAPVGWIVREALKALAPGGTVAVNAIRLDAIPDLDYVEHLYGERTLRSVTNFTHQDADEFLALAAQIPVRPRVEAFPLREANGVLQAMKESRLEAAAVLVADC